MKNSLLTIGLAAGLLSGCMFKAKPVPVNVPETVEFIVSHTAILAAQADKDKLTDAQKQQFTLALQKYNIAKDAYFLWEQAKALKLGSSDDLQKDFNEKLFKLVEAIAVLQAGRGIIPVK